MIAALERVLGGLTAAMILAAWVLWSVGDTSLATASVLSLGVVNVVLNRSLHRLGFGRMEAIRTVVSTFQSAFLFGWGAGAFEGWWLNGFVTAVAEAVALGLHYRTPRAGIAATLFVSTAMGAAGLLAGHPDAQVVLAIAAAGVVLASITARMGATFERLGVITAQANESERRVRGHHRELFQFLRHMPLGVHVMDADGRHVFANETMLSYAPGSDFTPGAEVSTAGWRFRLHVRNSDERYPLGNLPAIRALAGEFAAADDVDVVWVDERGRRSRRTMFTRAAPIRDDDGELVYALAIYEDVTDKIELEAERLQTQHLGSIGHLAAGVAREISTPMQYIGDNNRFLDKALANLLAMLDTYRSWLADDDDARDRADVAEQRLRIPILRERIPEAIRSTASGIASVTGIVAAMEEFADPATDDKIPVDLNRAIATARTVSRNEWKYSSEVELHLDPDLPFVPCIPGELNQVFLNLIVNAAHAIAETNAADPLQKGLITIRTRSLDRWVEVRIADTGGGIAPSVRDRIFDPYFTTKEVGRGTGQGLAFARDVVVEQHGGTIDVEIDRGVGTTFVIRLPVTEAEDPTRLPGADRVDA